MAQPTHKPLTLSIIPQDHTQDDLIKPLLQQSHLTFSYNPQICGINKSLRGKPGAVALKDLTPEEKEAHRIQNQRERNKRYHDKAKIYNTLEGLPTNKDRILLVLRLFNPTFANVNQSKLETDLTNLLDSFGLH